MEDTVPTNNANNDSPIETPLHLQPQTPAQPRINYWMISTLILALVLIGGGLYMFNEFNNSNQQQQLLEPISQSQSTPIASGIPETEKDTTYVNEEYGFSVRIPKNFETTEKPYDTSNWTQVVATNETMNDDDGVLFAKDNELILHIDVLEKNPITPATGPLHYFDFINELSQEISSLTASESAVRDSDLFYNTGLKLVDGVSFQIYRTAPNVGFPGSHIDSVGAIGVESDKLFHITVEYGNNLTEVEAEKLLNETLSSFKLL